MNQQWAQACYAAQQSAGRPSLLLGTIQTNPKQAEDILIADGFTPYQVMQYIGIAAGHFVREILIRAAQQAGSGEGMTEAAQALFDRLAVGFAAGLADEGTRESATLIEPEPQRGE